MTADTFLSCRWTGYCIMNYLNSRDNRMNHHGDHHFSNEEKETQKVNNFWRFAQLLSNRTRVQFQAGASEGAEAAPDNERHDGSFGGSR